MEYMYRKRVPIHSKGSTADGKKDIAKADRKKDIAKNPAIIYTEVFKSRSQRLPMGGRRIWKKYANSMLGSSVQCFTLRSGTPCLPIGISDGHGFVLYFFTGRRYAVMVGDVGTETQDWTMKCCPQRSFR